jgi:beta-glucosidase
MSEIRLRQIYLPPYKSAIEAGAASVMSAFNALNGVPANANPFLLKTILRRQWGFDGPVVSDYTAIMELEHHGIAIDGASAAGKALNAGVDIDMMSHLYDTQLLTLVESGRVSLLTINEAPKVRAWALRSPLHDAARSNERDFRPPSPCTSRRARIVGLAQEG